ncbi:hypothetical protein EDC01DRAFT_629847 [Geopyxis carbonaria]|nr:hypothetical protein EDC01DRAFT_629847 [Geopyxis carbonaria]
MAKTEHITTASKANGTNTAIAATTNGACGSVNEGGHKTTAATLAKVAAVQDEIRNKSAGDHDYPPIPPKDPKKNRDYRNDSPLSPGMTSFTATTAAIQRIAESGAPPISSSRNKTPKPKAASLRAPSKSPPAINTPTHLQVRSRGPPSSPLPEEGHQPQHCPGPHRSSSQDKNFLKKIKKGREQIHAEGLKATSFLNKVSHQTWDKLKNQRLAPGKSGGLPGRSASPQMGHSHSPTRDTSNDIDVWGMHLKETVIRTRIVRTRKMSGDATYWMPAIAYRCLQYLNVYGPHELGIYRISGSTSVVDELKAEFKIHHDVDLFESPPDDLHTVSSLLKGWFRSLPDAILPQDVQKRIYDKCKDETESPRPPKAFVEELSMLPPYNYYLLHHLFSHLSTICMASDINKMNLANLGMIFCSTLRIDRFCFNWLVNSWADCWAGCLTEDDEYERTLPRRHPSDASTNTTSHQTHSPDSRSTSRTGRTMDGTEVERWPSSSSRSVQNMSPIPRPSSRARSDRHPEHERERDKDAESLRERAWEKERDQGRKEEKEREREREREHLEIRGNSPAGRPKERTPSVYSLEDDRHLSMVVEANGTPRGSISATVANEPPRLPAKVPITP